MSTAVRRRTVFQSEQDPILNPPEGYRVPGPSNEPDPRLNPPSDTYAPGPPMVTPAPTQQGRKAIPRVPPGNEAPPPDTTTPPPPPAPTKPQWTAPSDGDWRKWWFANVVQNGQLSVQRLKDVTADLAKLGIKVLDDDEIQLPNGQIIDVIRGASAGGTTPIWLTGAGAAAAAAKKAQQPQFQFPDIEVGTDPLSQAITNGLMELIANYGNYGPDTEALQLENVRAAADRARRAEMAGLMGELANRGLLPESAPGGMGGLALDALTRLEQNEIAPLFAEATRDYLINDAERAQDAYLWALGEATSRQNVLSQIAIQSLAQNVAFNQFLAEFGLTRDEVLAKLAAGQDDALIALLMAYLQAVQVASGGHV
jgi:hypothetical protein